MPSSVDDRQIIVITGNPSDCLLCAEKLTQELNYLFLDDTKKAHTVLGQEFDAVIFDCHNKFNANAFGAITGTIRGGGYLLLLRAETTESDSLFLERFWCLLENTHYQIVHSLQKDLEALSAPPKTKPVNEFTTLDQNDAVNAIINVVKGHRRRPLVITADRGRGKSASLGIASAALFKKGYENIIVCAPSKKHAEIIFKHALKNNPECNLCFYSPDDLNRDKPKADLVLIDEAAAIPVSLLTSFLKQYSRIVFSSTQHGYEGSGRGFAISFKKVLDHIAPEWKSCRLKTPIRWKENDALESFVFDALLLNAEPVADAEIINATQLECSISTLSKTELISNQTILTELFGLLVSAHYQTKPSDLMNMLDDELISIHATFYNKHIIAVALVIKEGGIGTNTATKIFEGTRRLQGHLVAQSLAANAGIESAPCLLGERVIRVAVHPKLQQQSFGSTLLNTIIKHSKADYISTSFGANTELLKFWKKQSFVAVYMGMKRDASNGTHSIIMLHSISYKGKQMLEKAERRFNEHFPHLLSEPFRQIEAGLASALLTPSNIQITAQNELKAFAYKQRGYENTFYPLWQLVCNRLSESPLLSKEEKEILVLKVLQKHDWTNVVIRLKGEISGKKDALILLRQAISRLLEIERQALHK